MPFLTLALAVGPWTTAALAEPSDPKEVCKTDGVWFEKTMNFTTRIASSRWQTWAGGPEGTETTAPAGHGWVEKSSVSLTFAYDNSKSYPYEWRFEEGCAILHLSHPVQVLRLQRVSSVSDGERQGG